MDQGSRRFLPLRVDYTVVDNDSSSDTISPILRGEY